MKKTWLLALMCVSIVLSSSLLRMAVADDDEIDDDDEIELTEDRELEIVRDTQSIIVKSDFKNETMENEYEIEFAAEDGIHLDLDFSSEVNATEFELEVSVLFSELVEFVDRNGDGVSNATEEVQTVDLTNMGYSSPTVTQTTSKDGISGYTFECHTVDEPFIFQILAEMFPKSATIDGTTVKPSEMKITIVIKDFPYKQSGSLALMVKATSELEVEEETGDTEKEVEVKSATAKGYFSWSNEVSVDNVPKEVKSNVVSTDEGKLIALSYPNGKEIVHDPKLGVSLISVIASFPWQYMAIGAALVTLAVALVIRTLRPKMNGLTSPRVHLTKGESYHPFFVHINARAHWAVL